VGKTPFLVRRRAGKLVDEAHALDERGDQDGAWAKLEAALNEDRESFDAEFLLGRIANDRTRPDIAASHLERAVALNPNAAHAYGELGRAYHELRRRADAEKAYQRSLELKNDPYTAINFATLLRDTGRFQEATAMYERALSAPGLDKETAEKIRGML
jgi:tetratricopeptide (TPR) repeat protein